MQHILVNLHISCIKGFRSHPFNAPWGIINEKIYLLLRYQSRMHRRWRKLCPLWLCWIWWNGLESACNITRHIWDGRSKSQIFLIMFKAWSWITHVMYWISLIADVIAMSRSQCRFPDNLKFDELSPLCQRGTDLQKGNYRPVCI